MLAELALVKEKIESYGAKIVIVHMSEPEKAKSVFGEYGLQDQYQVSDPECKLYKALDLKKGSFGQLFSPQVFSRALQSFQKGFKVSGLEGDGFQMQGSFLIHNGIVIGGIRPYYASQKIDFLEFYCEHSPTPCKG